MKMEKNGLVFVVLSMVAMLLYTGCDRDSDGEEEIPHVVDTYDQPTEVIPKHHDPVFDSLVCYPVGTTWEKGYSLDDFEHFYVRSRFEVVSDTLIDGKNYKRVKGEIVHFDTEHIPDNLKGNGWGIFPGYETVLDPLDFYLYEDKGVVTAYDINPATQRPSNFLKQYDFNWPPYMRGLLFYSDGNVVDAEIPRSSMTLLDGNVYEIEDYRVYTRLMKEKMGYRNKKEAFLVKTIGCIYAMFGVYCDSWLKGRLLSFYRNGELLYEYGKVELPEKKHDDLYPSPMEKVPDLIGEWNMVEYFDIQTLRTREIKEGSIEWTFNDDGDLYVKCDSTVVGYLPFLQKGKYSTSHVTESEFEVKDSYSTHCLYLLIDGILTVHKDTWYGSYCTFKKKQ